MAADNKYDIKHLHEVILIIADEIDRICKKNKIEYSLIDGTLLGAVRHTGFIPWDDDFDIAMTRENYEKFRKCCERELGENFLYIDWNTDDNYTNAFAKIMLKGTKAVEEAGIDIEIPHHIFVDIFPYDHIPKKKTARKYHSIVTKIYLRMFQLKQGVKFPDMSLKKKLAAKPVKILSMMFSRKFLKKRCEANLRKYNDHRSYEYANVCGFYGYKSRTKAAMFSEYMDVPFEDRSYRSIVNNTTYLANVYGDYMKLPPVEKRRSHDLVEVDFGNY